LTALKVLPRNRRLTGLAGLLWLFGFYLALTALAAPYVREIGAGPAAVGVLMAADLPGAVLGSLLVARVRSAVRPRLMVPLAAATGLPLIATAFRPAVPLAVLLWAGSGVLSSYMTLAQAALTQSVPDAIRGRTVGIAAAGLQTAQGLGALLAGAIAAAIPPSASIAICAAAGSAGALAIGLMCRPGQATGETTGLDSMASTGTGKPDAVK
jgi:MFS family permease